MKLGGAVTTDTTYNLVILAFFMNIFKCQIFKRLRSICDYSFILTQYANKKDHFRTIKIMDFEYFFREAWHGSWVLPEPKNFGPGHIARAQGPVLGAIFGQNGQIETPQNHFICQLLTISR